MPKVVGNYRLEKELGSGSFAKVRIGTFSNFNSDTTRQGSPGD